MTDLILKHALRLLTRLDAAQYLLSNTAPRMNGAMKAHHHLELTKPLVCEPDTPENG